MEKRRSQRPFLPFFLFDHFLPVCLGARRRAVEGGCMVGNEQCPEFKFRFVFFRLQMLRFSALCEPNEQKFGELLT